MHDLQAARAPVLSRIPLLSHLVLLRRHLEQAIDDRILVVSCLRPVASALPTPLALGSPDVCNGDLTSTVVGVAWGIGDCWTEGDGGIC